MSSTLRSGGRGGAGNFVSQEDVEAAEKARRDNDPEAQRSSPLGAQQQQTAVPVAAPQYVRTGRGGAGNFAEPPTVAESRDRQDVVDRTRAAVSASHAGQPRAGGLSGRGGAGNWTDDDGSGGGGGDAGEEGAEHARQQQIADQVAQDIGASLAPPPKTYHQHDRDMG